MSTRRRRQRSSLFPYTTLFRSMALLMMSLMRFSGRLRSHGKGFLPVVFGTGGQLLNPGQKSRHFPYEMEEHTSELQSQFHLVCRLLLEKKNVNRLDVVEGNIWT